jgi:hypothetical protein
VLHCLFSDDQILHRPLLVYIGFGKEGSTNLVRATPQPISIQMLLNTSLDQAGLVSVDL